MTLRRSRSAGTGARIPAAGSGPAVGARLRREIGPEVRALLVIAAPLAAAYLAEIAMMITDMVIVGRLGGMPLAAVGLASDLVIEILVFCFAILSIVAVLVARSIGSGEEGSGTCHVRQGLWVATALSLPAVVLCWQLPSLLGLTDQDPQVLALAERYLNAVV